jgi:hypothetical protein
MAAKKRTSSQILRDRAEVARMYLRGISQSAIAAILTRERERAGEDYEFSPNMVKIDLRELRKEWRESALLDFHARKAQELADVDQIEAAAWEAWERSHGETRIMTTKTTAIVVEPKASRKRSKFAEEHFPEDDLTDGGGFETEATERVEYLAGDARFLEVALKCVEKRCKILGLDAPVKVDVADVTDRPADPWSVVDATLDRIAARTEEVTAEEPG